MVLTFLYIRITLPPRYYARQEELYGNNPLMAALLRVAVCYLTPPASSTCVERLFSNAGLILEDKRSRTDPNRLNRILFLREKCLMLKFSLDWL